MAIDFDKYFNKFKTTDYNNYKAVDITQRTKILDAVYSNPFVYYPYDMIEGDRADRIAEDYYNDPYASWLIYHSNKIIDPYFDWHMTNEEFNRYISKKYGSISVAQQKTKFFRVDWADDDQNISTSYYTSTLSDGQKKYWSAQFAPSGTVISYKRKEVDWLMNTNLVLELFITKNSNTNFTNSEVVTLKLNTQSYGTFEPIIVSNTRLVVQHIDVTHESFNLSVDEFSNTTPNVTFYAVGQTSAANANISSYRVLQRNIPVDEFVYWNKVTYYDYENELNEKNKTLYLLDNRYYEQATLDLKKALKE